MKLLAEVATDVASVIISQKADKIARLNRIQALMSGINTLIVQATAASSSASSDRGGGRVPDRLDRRRRRRRDEIVPVASAGADPDFLTLIA